MSMVDFKLGEVGSLFTDIRKAITGETIQDPQKVLEELTKFETNLQSVKGKIIEAEAKSEHWIVSSWRPLTMLTFTFIVANNYILVPYMNMFLITDIKPLELTQDMWELLKIGLGGYIVGRSVEKATKHYSEGKNK